VETGVQIRAQYLYHILGFGVQGLGFSVQGLE
jgi:hypothetical protein